MATCRAAPETIGIAVMAKAPVAGYAKTRLVALLGAAGAARLHRQLMLRTLATACAAEVGPVALWCAPDARHRFFRALHRKGGLALHEQAGADLGERMAGIFAGHGSHPLLLIGTDCPELSPDHLRQAALALRSTDAVFITTEDGGYFLVGLRRPCPALFTGMRWGTDQVMAQTRHRLVALGLSWRETARLWDVDRAEDVLRWQALR
jgi:rSAM/selenodomain-associated transferase 1